jgi:hypothetical protein
MTLRTTRVAAVLLLWMAGCSAEQEPVAEEVPGVQVRFDLSGDWKDAMFLGFPYPSDLAAREQSQVIPARAEAPAVLGQPCP